MAQVIFEIQELRSPRDLVFKKFRHGMHVLMLLSMNSSRTTKLEAQKNKESLIPRGYHVEFCDLLSTDTLDALA